MRAKLLQHPTAAAGTLARPTRSPSFEVTADSGLPNWFFWLVLSALPVATILGAPFNLPLLAVLWGYYFYCVITSPERAIFVFLLTMMLIKLVPIRGIPLLPGMNSDTVFIVSLAFCAIVSRSRQPQPPASNVYTKPILFMVLVLSLSAILSYGTGAAQHHTPARGWFPYGAKELFSDLKSDVFYLFLAPIACRLLWNRKQMKTALVIVIIYAVLVCIDGLLSRNSEDLARTIAITGRAPRWVRAAGSMFYSPNGFGGFLAIVTVPLFAVLLSRALGLRNRILLGSAIGVLLGGLIYSMSRGAWLSFLTGFLVFSLLRGARGVVVLVVAIIAATAYMPQVVIDRYKHTVREAELPGVEEVSFDASTEGRVERWRAVPGYFFEAPVIGHGYKTFPRKYALLNRLGFETGPHSTLTELLVEEGSFGMLAYGWIMWVIFRTTMFVRRQTDDPLLEALATGLTAGMVTLIMLDLTGNRLMSDGLMAPMWLLLGGVGREYANLRSGVVGEGAVLAQT